MPKVVMIMTRDDDGEYTMVCNASDIEELSDAMYNLMEMIYEEERLGNAWNYAMERFEDMHEEEVKYTA